MPDHFRGRFRGTTVSTPKCIVEHTPHYMNMHTCTKMFNSSFGSKRHHHRRALAMSHYYSPDVPYSQAMSRPQLQHFHFITGLPSLYSKECDALLLPGMAWPGLYPGIAPNINPPTKLHRPGHHLPSQTLDTTPTTTHGSNHTLPPPAPLHPHTKKTIKVN